MKLALAAALAALTWFPIAAHTFTVCVIPSSPWTSCSTNVTLPITFAGFDVELFRFVAAQVGWREDAGSHNASVASGQWAFRCSNQYWDPLLARMSANNSEDPAAAPCAALIGSVIPTALRYQAGSQFSAPHYHTGLAMMVARNTHSYFDIWGFLKPFDWSMWVSLGVTLLLMPAIVWFVERLNVHGYIPLSWTSLHECKAATYSTLLACFNIKVYDVTTLPARLVVVMYLFLVLITISTYVSGTQDGERAPRGVRRGVPGSGRGGAGDTEPLTLNRAQTAHQPALRRRRGRGGTRTPRGGAPRMRWARKGGRTHTLETPLNLPSVAAA